jgi:predicted NACHT family NTPase
MALTPTDVPDTTLYGRSADSTPAANAAAGDTAGHDDILLHELNIMKYVITLDRQLAGISELFVPLSVRPEAPLPALQVTPAHVFLRHGHALEGPEKEDFGLELRSSTPLTTVVDQRDAVVIRGDPGAGKTESCRYLSQRACREIVRNGWSIETSFLPAFIELHRFALENGENTWDALARLVAYALRQAGALPADVQPLPKYGRVFLDRATAAVPSLICLDGLNEVTPKYRDGAYDAINQLVTSLRGTRSKIVITTRRHGFEAYRLGALQVYDVQPLIDTQIRDYLSRRLGFPRESVNALYDSLSEKIRHHASNPLHLNLICDIVQQGDPVPASRAQLFKVFAEGIIERWDQKTKLYDFGQRNFDSGQKYLALEAIALEMQLHGRNLSSNMAATIIANNGPALPSLETAASLLEELCTNHILRKRGDAIEFIHHTFQEYFCAAALKKSWERCRTK